jgi:hypothetical protein
LRTAIETTPYRQLPSEPATFAVDAVVERDGSVEVSISTLGQAIDIGRRVYGLLSAGGFHRQGNAEETLTLMEAMHFAPGPPPLASDS